MNRHELAQLRLKQLMPLPASVAGETLSDLLEEWLRDDVVPVVEDLTNNPVFRQSVLLVPGQLFRNSGSAQRAKVSSLADAMVTCAQTLVDAAHEFNVLDALSDQDRDQDKAWLAVEGNQSFDARCVVEKIAERPWFDVASPEDSWAPTAHLNLKHSDPLLTRQFRRLNLYSKLLGDHVVGMMFARLDFWKQRLDAGWTRLQVRLGGLGSQAFAALNGAFEAFIDMDAKYKALLQEWLSGSEPRTRNACMVLLQAYVAYRPSPELTWLGSDRQSLAVHGAVLRNFFRHRGTVHKFQQVNTHSVQHVGTHSAQLVDTRLIQQVAAALEDIAEMYRRGVHADDLIEEARHQYQLLVVVRPRMVFWGGELVAIKWENSDKAWNLMLNLAVKAEGRLPLHAYEVTGAKIGRGLSVRKSNLIKLLSRTTLGENVGAIIDKARGGDCRLDLESHEVKVLDLEADAWTVNVEEFQPVSHESS